MFREEIFKSRGRKGICWIVNNERHEARYLRFAGNVEVFGMSESAGLSFASLLSCIEVEL